MISVLPGLHFAKITLHHRLLKVVVFCCRFRFRVGGYLAHGNVILIPLITASSRRQKSLPSRPRHGPSGQPKHGGSQRLGRKAIGRGSSSEPSRSGHISLSGIFLFDSTELSVLGDDIVKGYVEVKVTSFTANTDK